jgi:ArsR family transcriptional regulator, arsenate/arsenite/antimonite-responsive transcriptional repressor
VDDLTLTLKALADPVRLQILEFLRDPVPSSCSRGHGVCGCDFEAVLSLSQPTVSHHMKVLTEAGLVRGEKRGRWVFYELEHAAFLTLLERLRPFAAATPARSSSAVPT